MAKDTERYFNFPINLLQNFLGNSNEVLHDIVDVGIYLKSLQYKSSLEGDDAEMMEKSMKYLCIQKSRIDERISNAKKILNSKNCSRVIVGLNTKIFWQFYKNEKSELDKVCLLAYLAIKSILGTKPYCKITNEYWFSRMAGYSSTIDKNENHLPNELIRYYNHYQARKIKFILATEWHVVNYSNHNRGFYVSLKLTDEELIYQVEKKRKSYLEKQYRAKQKNAREVALSKLNSAK